MTPPNDLIQLGHVAGVYGLKGWVNVTPASEPNVLLANSSWWLLCATQNLPDQVQGSLAHSLFKVSASKVHGQKLVAKLVGIEDRDAALKLKGCGVFVSRTCFPVLGSNEFYWVDLQGCQVKNTQGETIGLVNKVVEHGAHPILEVGLHLIPFVAAYILDVQLKDKQILVDWQVDYT